MTLADLDFKKLADLISEAVKQELPLLEDLRSEVRKLKVEKLGSRPCRSIAPVATDGGENRITFEPLNFEMIRVVDSNGQNRIETVIPLSLENSTFSKYAESILEVQKLISAVSSSAGRALDFDDLSYLVTTPQKERQNLEEKLLPDIKGRVRAFRDILEWAVLYEMACKDWPVDVLLLRDGLLRSKIFKLDIFPYIDAIFKDIYLSRKSKSDNHTYILGVAKSSAVLSKLALAILLEGVFNKSYPCYVEVPEELEARCYNFDRTWLDTYSDLDSKNRQRYQSFGKLHLVKLSEHRTCPVFPVDVPSWLPKEKRSVVLEYLAYDARATFPYPGYPQALQRAHDFANMSGFEVSILSDLIIKQLLDALPREESEKIIRHVNLGKALIKGGIKNGN